MVKRRTLFFYKFQYGAIGERHPCVFIVFCQGRLLNSKMLIYTKATYQHMPSIVWDRNFGILIVLCSIDFVAGFLIDSLDFVFIPHYVLLFYPSL